MISTKDDEKKIKSIFNHLINLKQVTPVFFIFFFRQSLKSIN